MMYDAPYSISLQLAQHHLQRDSSRTPDLREHNWAAATDVDLGSDSNDE